MKFQQILKFFLPHTPEFYTLFENAALNVHEAALLMKRIVTSDENARDLLIPGLEEYEHTGDEITHSIYNELSKTFITPIDREDIHDIATNLDDILDLIYSAGLNIKLYRVTALPPEVLKLVEIIEEASSILVRTLPLLGDMKQTQEIEKACVAVNSCENKADDIFHEAIASLFERNHDPITIIKLKDIFNTLEYAVDKCENVANLLENVVIKYA